MTADRFRTLCYSCGWTPGAVARRCGYNESSGRWWATGRAEPPPAVAEWLERAAATLETLPPPAKPGRRPRMAAPAESAAPRKRGRPRKEGSAEKMPGAAI